MCENLFLNFDYARHFIGPCLTACPRASEALDRLHAVRQASRCNGNVRKAEVMIGLCMHAFETQGLLHADPPCRGQRDEAKMLYEEDVFLIDGRWPPLQYASVHVIVCRRQGIPGRPPGLRCRWPTDRETGPRPSRATRAPASGFAVPQSHR